MTGNTIYNLDAMGDYECDDNDRPLYPPRIITTEVLLHPFDDIVPRDLKTKKPLEDSDKPKQKLKKNKALLSFGDDEEAPGIKEGIRAQTKPCTCSFHARAETDSDMVHR